MNDTLLALVFVGHVVLGVVGTLAVYKALERNWMYGWLFSLGLAGATVYAEWKLGEELFYVTVAEQKVLVVTAVIGALVGILSTVILTKPDIARDHRVQLNEQNIENTDTS
jgi:cytosine/uracil/thiamine/allantoin permease